MALSSGAQYLHGDTTAPSTPLQHTAAVGACNLTRLRGLKRQRESQLGSSIHPAVAECHFPWLLALD